MQTHRKLRLAAIAFFLLNTPVSAQDYLAPKIGDWTLSEQIRSPGETRTYFIDTELNPNTDLQILCAGQRFHLRFVMDSRQPGGPWRGQLLIALDNEPAPRASIDAIGERHVFALDAALSEEDVKVIRDARASLHLGIDGRLGRFHFPAVGADAALRALAAACSFGK